MITPPYLKKGDKIGIVAPSGKIVKEKFLPALDIFKSWGVEIVLGENLFNTHHTYAGTDEQRLSDFQKMLDDDSIKAIICARGGYGMVRIIDKMDFTNFVRNPKWITGFSDITVLHNHIHKNFLTETIHGIMPLSFPKSAAAVEFLRKALFGEKLNYDLTPDPSPKERGTCENRSGVAEGTIVGGNLAIIYSLSGTNSDINTDGKILFIEDLNEYLYNIDRMILNLKRTGKLKNLAGLIVGGMSDMKDNEIPFGKTAEEIIWDAVKECDYPVCFGFPAGHIDENYALILGRNAKLIVEKNKTCLDFSEKNIV